MTEYEWTSRDIGRSNEMLASIINEEDQDEED